MLKLVLSTAFIAFSSASFAALLSLTPGEQKIADISIAKSAQVDHKTEKANLSSVGAGLRNKKVVFVNVKVYVGQLFVTDVATFSKATPLESIKNQSAVAMQMTFLRDVDAAKIYSSFEDSLKANGIDPKDTAIAPFLAAIKTSGDVKTGQSITAVSFKKDKSDLVLLETTDGKLTELSGESLAQKVFSLWFGKTTDNGVEEMKKSILN